MAATDIVTGPVPEDAERSWHAMYVVGGVAALLALAGMVLDIALTMQPGWGAGSVPVGAHAWLGQFASDPLLGMRNLDFLNTVISLVALPMYVAVCGAHRRTALPMALLGLVFVAVGTAVFVSANAAMPMLTLSRAYEQTGPAERLALLSAAEALLASGAHGSYGAYAGFLISEIGTLIVAFAMLTGGVFRRVTGWVGVVGVTILAGYTTAYTFGGGDNTLVMAVAIPGGLLMVAWYVMVGVRLVRLGRGAS